MSRDHQQCCGYNFLNKIMPFQSVHRSETGIQGLPHFLHAGGPQLRVREAGEKTQISGPLRKFRFKTCFWSKKVIFWRHFSRFIKKMVRIRAAVMCLETGCTGGPRIAFGGHGNHVWSRSRVPLDVQGSGSVETNPLVVTGGPSLFGIYFSIVTVSLIALVRSLDLLSRCAHVKHV